MTGALVAHREQEVRDRRASSLRSLEHLVETLGYPTEWAVELEQRAWEKGDVWRIVDRRDDRTE